MLRTDLEPDVAKTQLAKLANVAGRTTATCSSSGSRTSAARWPRDADPGPDRHRRELADHHRVPLVPVPLAHLRPGGGARRRPRRLDHARGDRGHLLAGHDPRVSKLLQIDQFKIDLPMVAAFLTLIGFSVNDTIVIFDRIREIKGKTPYLTDKMVNDALNQTLSRTILTSLTAWLVVVILYFFGGEGLHGFAFALVVGFLSGTYSTIYIATPILIDWVGTKNEPPKTAEKKLATAK